MYATKAEIRIWIPIIEHKLFHSCTYRDGRPWWAARKVRQSRWGNSREVERRPSSSRAWKHWIWDQQQELLSRENSMVCSTSYQDPREAPTPRLEMSLWLEYCWAKRQKPSRNTMRVGGWRLSWFNVSSGSFNTCIEPKACRKKGMNSQIRLASNYVLLCSCLSGLQDRLPCMSERFFLSSYENKEQFLWCHHSQEWTDAQHIFLYLNGSRQFLFLRRHFYYLSRMKTNKISNVT